jgi:microcystin-dependent protein
MAFNLGSCPTGWSEYTAGRGRSIIWVWQWNTAEWGWLGTNWALWATTGAETHTLTEAQMPAHNHAATNAAITQNMWYTPSGATYFAATVWGVTVNNANPTGTTWSSQSHNNMQASVALLYCQKS